MGSFGGFICVLLLALGLHTCRSQSIIMWQVNRMSNEIDEMVTTAKADAETYVNELNKLFENLNATASSKLAEINNAISNSTSSVSSFVSDSDIDECGMLAAPVIQTANDIDTEVSACIKREVAQAEEEVGLTIPYVHSQLDSLINLQSLSHHCVSRYQESAQESADANQALACVWPLHRSAELFMLRFEFIVDKSLARILFNGFETRVATCGSIGASALESLTNSAQEVYERIETCMAESSS